MASLNIYVRLRQQILFRCQYFSMDRSNLRVFTAQIFTVYGYMINTFLAYKDIDEICSISKNIGIVHLYYLIIYRGV